VSNRSPSCYCDAAITRYRFDVDATNLAAALFEPIPAHATVGVEVVRAAYGFGEVAVPMRVRSRTSSAPATPAG
jgi:hypothetical protein